MPNPPYSGALIAIRETSDGLVFTMWNWDDVPEDLSIPPAGPLSTKTLVGRSLDGVKREDGTAVTTKSRTRTAATRTEAKTKFGQAIDQIFPDTPA